jgi:hypothetical protein
MRDKSKEQYEEEINNLFKQYSEVSGSDMDAYRKTLFYRLMNTTAEYVFSKHIIIKNKEGYGEEIFTTIKNCIGSFDFTKGSNFPHYLKASIKQNLLKSNIQNLYFNKLNGLHISMKTLNKIKEVVNQKQLFTEYGKNANYEEMIHWIAKNLDLEPKTVKKYLDKQILLNTLDEYNVCQDEADGKHSSIFGNFISQNPEEVFIHAELLIEILDGFNEVFSQTQERVKPYLSRLLSAKYYDAALEARKLKKEYPFFDYKEIAIWSRERTIPNQKDIAESWKRNETDASRTIEKFEKRVREKLKKVNEQAVNTSL